MWCLFCLSNFYVYKKGRLPSCKIITVQLKKIEDCIATV